MAYSSLVNYIKLSPNRNAPRNNKIKKITIHHMAGNLTVEQCGSIFASVARKASSNYGVDSKGRVGLYVDESNRSWCSSSPENDHQAITIEVANDGGSPNWHVSDVAIAKLIDLCTDICKRNGIAKLNYTGDKNGNLTMHRYFASTLCPGPYLASKFPYIANEVNKRLGATVKTPSQTTTYTSLAPPFKVRVTDAKMQIHQKPASNSKVVGKTGKGVFTIVEVAGPWGLLRSKAGWIDLNDIDEIVGG